MEASVAEKKESKREKELPPDQWRHPHTGEIVKLSDPEWDANKFYCIKIKSRGKDKSEPDQIVVAGSYGPRPQKVTGRDRETKEEYQAYLESKYPPWARERGTLKHTVLRRNMWAPVTGHIVVRLRDTYIPQYELRDTDEEGNKLPEETMYRLPDADRFTFEEREISKEGYKTLLAKIKKDPKYTITDAEVKKYAV